MKNHRILWNSACLLFRQTFQITLAVFVLIFSGFGMAQDVTPTYTELDKGLVLDLTGNVGYIINPDGTLGSINLSDGQSRWSSTDKGKPLAFIDNQLLVQIEDSVPSNNLSIAYLNNASGNRIRLENRLLPNGIKSGIKSTMNYSFDTRVSFVNNQLSLSWDFQPTFFRGIADESGINTSNKGVFKVDKINLNMGNLGITNFSMAGPIISKELENNALNNVVGRKFSSIQDDYVVAIEQISNDSKWEKYKWTVYKRDGSRVGSIRSHLSFRPFYVVDNTLVFTTVPAIRNVGGELIEDPKSLVGYDLITGNQKWTKEILDLEYRGPFAP